MPIEVRCECGRRLHAPVAAAGRRVRCPSCRAAVSVPRRTSSRSAASGDRRPRNEATRLPSAEPPALPALPPKTHKARAGDNVFRPHGDGARPSQRTPKRRKKRRPHPADVPDSSWRASLKFPFRTETLLSTGVMAVLYTCLLIPLEYGALGPLFLFPRFMIGAVIVMVLIQGYFWHFLFQVLRTAAYHESDLPMTADWDIEGIVHDLRTAMGCAAVSFLPLVGYGIVCHWQVLADHPFVTLVGVTLGVLCLPLALMKVMGSLPALIPLLQEISPDLPAIALVLTIAGCAYWPMALLASGLHETLRAAMPWHVIPAILRVPGAYLGMLAMILAVAGLGAVLQFLAGLVPLLGTLLTWFVLLSGLTAIMHRLGALYYTNRHTLDWFPDAPRAA